MNWAINDPRFSNTTYSSSDTAGSTHYVQIQSQNDPYGQQQQQQSYQQPYQQSCQLQWDTQYGSTGGFTEGQIHIHSYGVPTTSGAERYSSEGQRQGPWYGEVQQDDSQILDLTGNPILCPGYAEVLNASHICRGT